MLRFIDDKKNKSFELPVSFMVDKYRSLTSGATVAIMSPQVNWQEVRRIIGVRQSPRNTPMGIVITKPSNTSFFAETVWEDTGSQGQHDGDITLFKEISPQEFSFRRFNPAEIKKLYPAWYPYHHEDKSYLK